MLAGLSKCASLRTPPGFCANAVSPAMISVTNVLTATTHFKFIAIFLSSRCDGYLSSQPSSMRQPLQLVSTMTVIPFT
jgi:hypothetical protein